MIFEVLLLFIYHFGLWHCTLAAGVCLLFFSTAILLYALTMSICDHCMQMYIGDNI